MNNENTTKTGGDSDKVGIVGSPSSTNDLTVDILGDSTKRKLIGELSYFKLVQDKISG